MYVFNEIFPAIDIVIIYYFSSYAKVRYWMIFFVGLILDQLYHMPTGSNSLIIITVNLALSYSNRWFVLKDEITNIVVFSSSISA
jgi:cell shape-determining protein MreD